MVLYEQLFTHTPDELFQKFNVSDIELMQSSLQQEINKKKDELRILVGEKYRDFIVIIDKIGVMNDLAVNITNRIDSVSLDLSNLNLKQDSTKSTNDLKKGRKNEIEYSIAILIKLLIDIEDQIWSEINRGKFMLATELLQLAVHIKTVLSLETTWQVDKKFPVVHEIWNSVLRFPLVLTQLVEEKLKSNDLSAEEASECLCTLSVLENLNCVHVIKRFLALRSETLKSTLNSEDLPQNVRARILNSYQIITSTCDLLYHCFKNNVHDNGLFWIQIESMTSLQNKPVLNFVKLDNTSMLGKVYVPAVVQNFRIKMANLPTPLDSFVFHQCINEWLLWVRQYSEENVRNLLNLIGSLKTLQLLQESVPALPKEWPAMLEYFNQNKSLNLWNELYEPMILEQAKILLLQQWDIVFDRVRAEIDKVTKKMAEHRVKEPEDNLHWYLWDSLEADISTNLYEKTDANPAKDLTIKSLGLSPNSGKLCLFLETSISSVAKELSNMSSEKGMDSEQALILKHHQQSCCIELIKNPFGNGIKFLIIKFACSLLELIEESTASKTTSESVIIFLARFLSGIAPLCSSLKHCIILGDEQGDEWSMVNAKLQERSLYVWRKWSSRMSTKIFAEFSSVAENCNTPSFRIKHIPKWDTITIKQETEDGAHVESEIKVPFQASFPLQNLLNSLASLIGCTLPPRIVIVEMIDGLLSRVLQMLTDSWNETLHQTIYIQFLFDIKYLYTLLVPIENDRLAGQFNTAVGKIESKIDPVDLDSITSYLSENVNQFAFKTQGLYGLLMNNKPRIVVTQQTDNAGDPNVAYSGGINVPWFPLLPVTTLYSGGKE